MFKIMNLPNGCDNSNEVVNIDSTLFTQQLKTKWDEIHSKTDVFRYKITNLRERIIDNKYIVLLNTERGSNRRAPEYIDNIRQPFDDNKFNFNKASPKEVIFTFNDSGGADIHSLLVNVSPISRYHTLLCPSVKKNLPQIVTEENFKLALEIKFLARDRDLRIGFNSLCAFASVNHLHYHLLFEKNKLHVETAEKLDNRKKTGSAGGTNCKETEVDFLVYEILGKESPVLEGLGVVESLTLETEYNITTDIDVSTPTTSLAVKEKTAKESDLIDIDVPTQTTPLAAKKKPSEKSDPTELTGKNHLKRNVIEEREELILKKTKMTIVILEKEIKLKDLQIQNVERDNYLKDLQILTYESKYDLPRSRFTCNFDQFSLAVFIPDNEHNVNLDELSEVAS